jgi:hypothetical protein
VHRSRGPRSASACARSICERTAAAGRRSQRMLRTAQAAGNRAARGYLSG